MISVIVPLYNTSLKIFDDTIKSLDNQTIANYELIIIDDGSNINYESILNKYCKCNIKYFKTNNYGVSHARNFGLEKSQGNYILFLDSDDYLKENTISIFNDYEDFDIVIGSNLIIDNNKTSYLNIHSNEILYDKSRIIKAILINDEKYKSVDTPWNKLYKKKFLIDNNIIFDESLRYGEDGLFNYLAYENAQSICLIDKVTYVYRNNQNSLCNSFHCDLASNTFILLNKYIDLYKKGLLEYDILSEFVFRNVIRLFRKYYVFYKDDDLKKEIEMLLENNNILKFLSDIKTNDLVKKELLENINESNIKNLCVYVESVCKKKLLKK